MASIRSISLLAYLGTAIVALGTAVVGTATDLLFTLFAPVIWLYNPSALEAIELHGIIRRVTVEQSADRRAGGFRGFISRALAHADFNGVGFTQAHRSVVPI